MFKIIWGVELFFITTFSYIAEDIVATQLVNVCENGQGCVKGAPYTPLKIMEDLCNSFKYLLLDNCMAKSAIILHSVCLVCLISHIEKTGQSDLVIFFCKNRQISIKFRLDTPLRMVIVVCTNHFDLTYFQ